MINLMSGQPSADLLPTKLFAEASQKALSRPNAANDMLQYPTERGHPDFLNNLALFLSKEYSSFVSSQNLCATPGASLSLQHILTILTRPQSSTRHVYFQDPTYFLSFDIFLNAGFSREQFIGIPEQDDSGIDIDLLQSYLIKNQNGAQQNEVFDSVLYCVPTHANPTGSILSAEKRKRLVQLGRQYNMLIICDDVYDILTYQGDIPQRLVAYDLESSHGKHVVISNGSFSKILAPGARAGWIEAGDSIIKRVGNCGSFRSGGSPSNLSCQIINEMLIDNSLHQHVAQLKKVHSNRLYEGLWEPIQVHLKPLGCTVSIKPKGGYFVWVKIPITGQQLVKIIQEHDLEVGVGVGTLFSVTRNDEEQYLVRLSFAHYDTRTLKIGVDRLKQAILIGIKSNGV